MNRYNFQSSLPVRFHSFANSLPIDKDDPSLYAICQLHIFRIPVSASVISYPHMRFNETEELTLLGNELFMMRLDLRCIWSGDHFRPDPEAVWRWLDQHGQKISEDMFHSFLVTDLGVYTLEFDMAHGDVTFRVYVRSMIEPAPAEEPVIALTCEEASLVRYALDLMYHKLQERNTEFDRSRMAKVAELEKRISEELKANHEAELAYIRSIGKNNS